MGSHIAMYLRLSQEDIDVKNGLLKDESNSIRSQRLGFIIMRAGGKNCSISGRI